MWPRYKAPVAFTSNVELPSASDAIHANLTGTYNLMFEGETASVPVVLTAGVTYPYKVKRVTGSLPGVLYWLGMV